MLACNISTVSKCKSSCSIWCPGSFLPGFSTVEATFRSSVLSLKCNQKEAELSKCTKLSRNRMASNEMQWNHRLSLANVFGLQTIVPFYSEDDCSKLRRDLSRISSNGSNRMPPSLDATTIKLYFRPQHQYQHHGLEHEPTFISRVDTSRCSDAYHHWSLCPVTTL